MKGNIGVWELLLIPSDSAGILLMISIRQGFFAGDPLLRSELQMEK